MSARAVYWLTGAVVVLVTSLAVDGGPEQRGTSVLATILALGVIGLIGEVVALSRATGSGRTAPLASDLGPADGQIVVAKVVAVRAEPNGHDPRFHRFIALEVDGTCRKKEEVSGVGSSRVDLQACKLEYSIVSPK